MEEDIQEKAFRLRSELLKIEEEVNSMHLHSEFKTNPPPSRDHAEMHANLKIAFRHIEDARMRLGKMVQAYDGGKSAYPR